MASGATVQPVTYPARPINGGPLELAPPKPGSWCYEPKYNGWRALVHAPSRTMFNRYGQGLSIAGLFTTALNRLRAAVLVAGGTTVEWFDCEALARRHELGRGTLLVFDYIASGPAAGQALRSRKQALAQVFAEHDFRQPPLPEQVYAVQAQEPAQTDPQALYQELKRLNASWRCPFYEGVVAKRTTDSYPVQLRSSDQEFVGWVKHRWAY